MYEPAPSSAATASWARGVYIGPGATVADRCRVQNYAGIYEPARLEEGVFIGPSVVLTNDTYPRAISPHGAPTRAGDWTPVGVTVRHGASVGARCVCVAPVTIGRWSLVAAGSVVTRDVPDYALVAGTPARWIKWVGRAGVPLEQRGDGCFVCPRTGERFTEHDGTLSPAPAPAP